MRRKLFHRRKRILTGMEGHVEATQEEMSLLDIHLERPVTPYDSLGTDHVGLHNLIRERILALQAENDQLRRDA